jgi:hypothetical protein
VISLLPPKRSEGQFSDDYDSSDYSSSNPAGENKISEAEIYSNESYDSDSMMITKIANYPKSSNDFDTKASKMNRKSFEQRRCNNNAAAIITRMGRKESGVPTSWCIS